MRRPDAARIPEWVLARLSLCGVVLLIVLAACNSGDSTTATLTGNVPITQQTEETISPTAVSTPALTSTADIAATAQAQGCHVTPYSGSGPGQLANYPLYPDWYGGDDLWMAPPAFSSIDPTLPETSQLWYAGEVPLLIATPADTSGAPQISGQLVNNPAKTLQSASGNVSVPPNLKGSQELYDFDVTFSDPGCWQITVAQGSAHLTAVVFVSPADTRPDIAQLAASHRVLQPYPLPAACTVTPWDGPKDNGAPYNAGYWLQGSGIALGSRFGILWAEAPNTLTVQAQGADQPTLTGQLSSEPAASLRASLVQAVGEFGSRWNATVVFPTSGCWRIQVTSGGQSFSATVYVYPAECQREVDTPVPATCQPPAG